MSKDIDTFLDGLEPDDAPVVEAPVAEPEPEVVAEPVVEQEPKEVKEPEVEESPQGTQVPIAALQAERRERQDWKEQALTAKGEIAALRAQIAAQPVIVPPPVLTPSPVVADVAEEQAPDPVEDPKGYFAYERRQLQKQLFNERLNNSEAMLRQALGDDEVNAKMDVFKKAATANPALRAQLGQQSHPYKWAYEQAQRIIAMDEIGVDPAAFREKLKADLRAEWEAEQAGTVQPRAAVAALPQSLGTARSAGPRSTPVLNIPESFDDILAQGRK